jgi:HK97 family phage major capsid protein
MDWMMAACGGTSTERFADDFDAAVADGNISAIVIDCDSPGGNVTGTPELAKRVFAARGKKKIVAVANSLMASAAYWICSAADEVVCTPSGEVGSIGVFCVHLDESGMNEMLGLKYTIIKAGAHKAEGNSLEPLSPEAQAFMEEQVGEFNDMFVGAVSKHRAVSVKDVNAKFGQGRCLTASQAKAAGMIDRIETLQDTLIRLGAKDVGASGRPRRAFGASAAVSAGDDRFIPAVVLRADAQPETAPDPTDDELDDGNLCPNCGADMPDDSDTCSACGAVRADDDADEDYESSADGAAAAAAGQSPEPVSVESTPVALDTTAAPGGATDKNAILAAERKRSNDIRALGAKHRLSADQINAMLDDGLTVEQASVRVLEHVEARGSASPTVRVSGMVDREAERPFASFGEQIMAVVSSGMPGRAKDRRLDHVNAMASQMIAGQPSGMNESTGSEGGFYIQNDLLPGVIEPVYNDDPILSRVNQISIGADKNGIKFNLVDETSRADGSRWGGIKMVYADEADTAAATKVKLRRVEMELKKIMGFGYLTDEMTQDAPAAQTLLVSAFQTELRFMLATGIFRGKGGGQLLGMLNSPALVTQAIEGTQTIANSPGFLYLNLPKMLQHMPAALWGDAIWLYNPELLPYLIGSTLGNTSIPLFVPYAGYGDQGAVDRILGRPAFVSDQCEAVGTPGDILLVAPSQYDMIQKGGAQAATSVHVRFLYDEMTLRITYRVDGQPRWVSSVTPYKGAAARSPYVALAQRV